MHIPVLLNETIAALDPKPNENFIDCTFGRGGHSLAILEKTAPKGRVLGIERDKENILSLPEEARANPRLAIVNDSYANIADIARSRDFENVKGILLDLGMSSWHLDESGKGFSFAKDEPLDMRYDSDSRVDAAKMINRCSEKDLAEIFKNFGQEKSAKKIARAIVNARSKKEITTTRDLARIIFGLPYPRIRSTRARIFQALRVAVNNEFENIRRGIVSGFEILNAGGRMAAISFHSLEDKVVKEEFKKLAESGRAKLLFKKPIVPSTKEIAANSRAASAKLRAIERVI